MIPVFLAVRDCTMTRQETRTSKYRKNEYMSKYTTMNGAKMAFKMPMKMKRLLSLRTHINYDGGMALQITHPSINAARFLLFRNTFLTRPLLSNRYSIKQNWRFHSRARVSVRPLPSSVGHPCGSGTLKSSSSLLKSAMRKFSCRMIRFAMSCASSLAPSLARGREDDEESSVSGLELRMAPMRRTTSGQEIVWISSWKKMC
jgi:hypothetical protein